MKLDIKRREALTNLARWYLNRRGASQGPNGLVYTVTMLPPSHSVDSVIKALDAAIAALTSEQASPAVWDNPDQIWAVHNRSASITPPTLAPPETSVSNFLLSDPIVVQESVQNRSPQAVPVVVREPRQSYPRLGRKSGTRDLRAQAADVPERGLVLPQRLPTCLRVGSRIADPTISPKPFAPDSLKLRISRRVHREKLPRSLHASLSPNTEMNSLVSAIDAVKESFKFQLSPLEPGLGDFSCDFTSEISCDLLRSHEEEPRSEICSQAGFGFLNSASSSSDLASTPRNSTMPQVFPPASSSCKNDGLGRDGWAQGSSKAGRGVRNFHAAPPLQPSPLRPERKATPDHRGAANPAFCNATLTALLSASESAAEDGEGRCGSNSLSERFSAFFRDAEELAHRAVSRQIQELRSLPDESLWRQALSQLGAASPVLQARARSLISDKDRKKKGMGVVFVD